MCREPSSFDPVAMNKATVVIGLELEAEEGALTGRLTQPDGDVTEFSGWLGLIAALDGLLESRPRRHHALSAPTHEGGTQ
jgi:hypothetical protein